MTIDKNHLQVPIQPLIQPLIQAPNQGMLSPYNALVREVRPPAPDESLPRFAIKTNFRVHGTGQKTSPLPSRLGPVAQLVDDCQQYELAKLSLEKKQKRSEFQLEQAEKLCKKAHAKVRTGVHRSFTSKEENAKLDAAAQDAREVRALAANELINIKEEQLALNNTFDQKYGEMFKKGDINTDNFKKFTAPYEVRVRSHPDDSKLYLQKLFDAQKMINEHGGISETRKKALSTLLTRKIAEAQDDLRSTNKLPDGQQHLLLATGNMISHINLHGTIPLVANNGKKFSAKTHLNSRTDCLGLDELENEYFMRKKMEHKNIAPVCGVQEINVSNYAQKALLMQRVSGVQGREFRNRLELCSPGPYKVKGGEIRLTQRQAFGIRKLIAKDVDAVASYLQTKGWALNKLEPEDYVINHEGKVVFTNLVQAERISKTTKNSPLSLTAQAMQRDRYRLLPAPSPDSPADLQLEESTLRAIMAQISS